MWMAIVGVVIGIFVAYIIWANANTPSLAELEELIMENDELLAESKALSDRSKAGPRIGMVAEIEFDYRDARGNDSRRHVNVEAVDREYLQGYCHKANDTRTFVIGRVRGEVTDVETGELLAPKVWAAEARQHPLNDPSLIAQQISRDEYADDQAKDEGSELFVEVCFTGFSKDRRAALEDMAEAGGFTVRKSVTVGLDYLVAGPNAGPSKLKQAKDSAANIIDEQEFLAMVT